jgi:hypothetical protein
LHDNGSVAKISVDGTDCPIWEQSPFSPKWWSFKINGPAVRYEVGISIQKPLIVWVNGPFQPAPFPDGKIARECGLYDALAPWEKFVCDGGYHGPKADKPTGYNTESQKMKARVRARHESINSRFKKYGILRKHFRHDISKHRMVFFAVANICQIGLMEDEPTFKLAYFEIDD